MTAKEYLSENCITPEKAEHVGFIFSIQAKLAKHLSARSIERIKDYVIAIRVIWPNYSNCPIDKNLLKNATRILRDCGWFLHLHEDHSDRISQYITRTD